MPTLRSKEVSSRVVTLRPPVLADTDESALLELNVLVFIVSRVND